MRNVKRIGLLLTCALVLAGCASRLPPAAQPVEVRPAQLPPPPSDVMVKRAPNFLTRLLTFLSDSPAKPTQ